MTVRLISATAVAFGALLFATGAQAAISVLGGGPAEMCFQAADNGQSPFDYIMYCNQALQGTLSATDRAATYINRGVLKLALSNTDSAANDFLAGLKINDKLGEGYVDLAATQITHKRFAEAIANINKGLALGTKQPQFAYYDRAMADEALGNLQGAYDDYRQALAIQPDFALASDELKRFKVVDKPSGT
jgi:tetratricopeptide (TPR) repeat protein